MDSADVNNENHAISPPNRVLGYLIRSRTKIYISYIIPSVLATFVYIVQLIADCAVSYEHFNNHQPEFGAATISLVLIPPFLTIVLVLSSKEQRENPKYRNGLKFFVYHIIQTLLFPFFAIYRFGVCIFWSIEALFQENNDAERMLCLERSTENATCELYLFIQAYAQAAPQIILQIYHMLMQDLFRDYQTTTAQSICIVFSAIDLAAITTSYHRIESQHQVGRAYPWSTPQQIETQRRLLECDSRLRQECANRKRDSERTITRFPESEAIMKNFEPKTENNIPIIHTVQMHGLDEVDNDELDDLETTALIHRNFDKTTIPNATDDAKIQSNPKLNVPPRKQNEHVDEITILDTIPDSPPPSLPTLLRTQQSQAESIEFSRNSNRNKRSSKTFSQLETFKDMLMVNAQLYIEEHVPHPPKLLKQRIEKQKKECNQKFSTQPPNSPTTPPLDEIDFFLPRPTKIINGIQQEDFAAKIIAFFGWIAYIVMRMLSLVTFCSFYPKAFFILVGVHYGIVLIALCLESRFKGKANVFLFYPILAYVFIFVLMEFRIKFKRIRLWFVGYFFLTLSENIAMTITWNFNEEFESWWFGFITESITYSGILFVGTLIVYFYLLKPKDVLLIVEDSSTNK